MRPGKHMTLSTDGCLFVSITGALRFTTVVHRLEGFISSKLLVFSLSISQHILDANVHCVRVCLFVCVWRVGVRAAQTGFYLSAHTWADFGESRHANRTAKAALTPMWPPQESPVSLRRDGLLPACLLPGTQLQMRTLHTHGSFSPPSFPSFPFHSVTLLPHGAVKAAFPHLFSHSASSPQSG